MSNHSDERVIATRRRWAERVMLMLYIALPVDLFVRDLVLKQDPRQYLDIWLIWAALVCLYSIGMASSGVEPFGGKSSMVWAIILTLAAGVPVALTLTGTVQTLLDFVACVVIAAASAFLALIILRVAYAMWERATLGRRSRNE